MKIAHTTPLFEKSTRTFPTFLLYVAICLALLAIDSRLEYFQNFRLSLKSQVLPAQYVLVNLQNKAADYIKSAFQTLILQNQINQSQQKLLLLEQEVNDLSILLSENKSLRQLLMMPKRQNSKWVTVEIMARQYHGTSQKVILSKGENDGLRLGLPVEAHEGLFGQISTVFPGYAEVTQINHLDMSVPAKIKGKSISGVLYGTGATLLEFRHFPQDSTLYVGDILLTSGLDDLFSPNVPIATIVNIEVTRGNSGIIVLAKPLVTLSESRFVVGYLGKQTYGEWLESLRLKELGLGKESAPSNSKNGKNILDASVVNTKKVADIKPELQKKKRKQNSSKKKVKK